MIEDIEHLGKLIDDCTIPGERRADQVALARKLLSIICQTLKNNWIFEDFPNFVLAQETA